MVIVGKNRQVNRRPKVYDMFKWSLFLFYIIGSYVYANDCEMKYNKDDIFVVSNKSVVFFVISQEEFDKLDDDEKEIQGELLNDFYYAFSDVSKILENNGVEIFLTSKRYIQFVSNNSKFCIDRLKIESPIGVILSDGINEPRIVLDAVLPVELTPLIEKYFNIKISGVRLNERKSPGHIWTPPRRQCVGNGVRSCLLLNLV